jgi:hypothetical protein
VDGAVIDHSKDRLPVRLGEALRKDHAEVDLRNARRAILRHLERAVDAKPNGCQSVPRQVPAGINTNAGGEAGHEQLGRRRTKVLTAGITRLIDDELVLAHLDDEPIVLNVPNLHRGHGKPPFQKSVDGRAAKWQCRRTRGLQGARP